MNSRSHFILALKVSGDSSKEEGDWSPSLRCVSWVYTQKLGAARPVIFNICMYIYREIRNSVYLSLCVHTCMNARRQDYLQICTYDIYLHICTYTYVCMYVCIHIYICVCVCVWLCVCMLIYKYMLMFISYLCSISVFGIKTFFASGLGCCVFLVN